MNLPAHDDAALLALLHEDVPYGDLTTNGLDIGHRPGRAEFTARHAMVASGVEAA